MCKRIIGESKKMIRKAEIADCSRLAEIHVFGWRCAYKDFIPLGYLFCTMSVKKHYEMFFEFLSAEDKTDETYVFEERNIIKGFMTMGDCRDDDKVESTYELQGIYVDPLFQRQKIGTIFVDFCIDEAIKRGKKTITLWVFSKNTESQLFYQKMGFIEDGKIKTIESVNEIAIRMRIVL